MTILTGMLNGAPSGLHDLTMVSPRKFTLSALSDTIGIIDPQSSGPTTCRALYFAVAGTVSVVDTEGNITSEVISSSMVDNKIPLKGFYNGVRSTGTSTIVASNIIVGM